MASSPSRSCLPILCVLLVVLPVAIGFYLPGVAPKDYAE
ncbi:hypothetical protein CBR_g82897, partial [Chara braunii]